MGIEIGMELQLVKICTQSIRIVNLNKCMSMMRKVPFYNLHGYMEFSFIINFTTLFIYFVN